MYTCTVNWFCVHFKQLNLGNIQFWDNQTIRQTDRHTYICPSRAASLQLKIYHCAVVTTGEINCLYKPCGLCFEIHFTRHKEGKVTLYSVSQNCICYRAISIDFLIETKV